jgi:hypothetical protein
VNFAIVAAGENAATHDPAPRHAPQRPPVTGGTMPARRRRLLLDITRCVVTGEPI